MASLSAAFAGLALSLASASLLPANTTSIVAVPSGAQVPARDSIVLRVMTTNDFHGALLPGTQTWSNGREVGGAAAIAGMMDRLAAECGCPTLRLDAGDVMQGTPVSNLSRGRATVEAYNAMGYAGVAVGNHEFDWSPDTLAARMRESRFAWLTANARNASGTGRPPWAVPWRMVRTGGLKVALVGYSSVLTPSVTRPEYVARLRFDGGAAIVDSLVDVARRDSAADFVILLAHDGGFCGPGGQGCRGEVFDLANALTRRPDLIVSGHTHSLVSAVVNGIPIVQARSNGTALGVVDFVTGPSGRTARVRVETVWADRERPDTAVARVVGEYRESTEPLTSRPVATLAEALPQQGSQFPLGNLIADALRAAAGADAAIINNGGIRAGLDSGLVTWGQLFRVSPFQNFVVRLTVTGAELRQALDRFIGARGPQAHVSGLQVTYVLGAPPGRRIASLALADGRPVLDESRYTLAVPDYLESQGAARALERRNTGVVDLDALVDHLRRMPQPVRGPAEVRMRESTSR